MDGDLFCNTKKCRKRLSTVAWVTSCSHVFCDDDGNKEFNKSFSCPACDTTLSGKFDIVRTDLQPSEQYKSMVLAGLKPEIIMEICSRAMAFWTYQAHQERTFQEFVINKTKTKMTELEQYYEQVINSTENELNPLRKENEATKTKFNEVSEKLAEKNRQNQKMQAMYDTLRRKCITPMTFESNSSQTTPRAGNAPPSFHGFTLPLASGEEILKSTKTVSRVSGAHRRPTSPAEKEFVMKPMMTTPAFCHPGGDQREGPHPFEFHGISVRTPR